MKELERNIQFDLPKIISLSKPIYPKMKIFYLVTLFIIGTTANVVPRQSKGKIHFRLLKLWLKLVLFASSDNTYKLCTIFSGCYCDSFVSNVTGLGNCGKSDSDGRTMCYVKHPDTSACSDLKDSSTHPDKKWSYKACESATTPNGMYFWNRVNLFTL